MAGGKISKQQYIDWSKRAAVIQKMKDEKYDPILHWMNIYLMRTYHYRKPPAEFHSLQENIIVARKKMFDLYIRLFDVGYNNGMPTIVIARIEFYKTRKGYGSNFLKLISEIAIKYQYEIIEFECCMTKPGISFAKKLGFQKKDAEGYDYMIETSKLVGYFQNHGK